MDRLPRPPSRRPGYQLADKSPHVNDRHPAESWRLCDLKLARLLDFTHVRRNRRRTPPAVHFRCSLSKGSGSSRVPREPLDTLRYRPEETPRQVAFA